MDPQYDALLYASAPEKAIIARVTVDEVVTAPVDELITTTLSEVPHTAAMLQEYFAGRTDGSALHIDAAERLSTPVEIATLRECGVSVPQNFQYLKPGRDDALLSRLDAVSVAE
jgi:predicted transcriptional regulator